MIQGVVVVNSRMRNVPTQLGNDWPAARRAMRVRSSSTSVEHSSCSANE
jgi:hypothetical protein